MIRRLAVSVLLLVVTAPASAAVFTVHGHGWGHGVGMSQWGARGFAERGWGWRSILTHYYPGTTLSHVERVKVRVLLAEGRDAVALSSRGPFRIVDARGVSRIQRRRIVFRGHRWHGLRPPLRIVPRKDPLTLGDNSYRGSFVIRRGISVVNVLPLERYLRGVVPWEMPSGWNGEALRAQAVASRTYALASLDPSSWYDLYPDTRDQMYGGLRAERSATNDAVDATAHTIVTWQGRPAKTFYFSTSGGRTQSSHDAFAGPSIPYLRAVADPYDSGPKHDWTYRFTTVQVARRLHVPLPNSFSVRLNSSGRVASVVVASRGSTQTISGNDFERALALPSTYFRLGAPPRARSRNRIAHAGWVAVLETGSRPFRGSVATSSFKGLRPGLWVRIKGPFASRADAATAASASNGYVKRVTR